MPLHEVLKSYCVAFILISEPAPAPAFRMMLADSPHPVGQLPWLLPKEITHFGRSYFQAIVGIAALVLFLLLTKYPRLGNL